MGQVSTANTTALRARNALEVVTTVAVLIAACVIIWRSTHTGARGNSATAPVPIPSDPISLAGAPTIGARDAKVAVLEFADFECPYCGRFAKETLPTIKSKYLDTGMVLFAFRHNPLTQIHPRAEAAAAAAECAEQQGAFWEFHDQLFGDPQKLQDADMLRHAMDVGIDSRTFKACLQRGASERVQRDSEIAKSLKLAGTPAFLVGRIMPGMAVKVSTVLAGAKSADDFGQAIEVALRN
jgi:protein-disulfide isomerase